MADWGLTIEYYQFPMNTDITTSTFRFVIFIIWLTWDTHWDMILGVQDACTRYCGYQESGLAFAHKEGDCKAGKDVAVFLTEGS